LLSNNSPGGTEEIDERLHSRGPSRCMKGGHPKYKTAKGITNWQSSLS